MKKAYLARTEGFMGDESSMVVFGNNPTEAKQQAHGNDYFDDYMRIRVTRMPSADKFANDSIKQLYWENIDHQRFFRKDGWHQEDMNRCEKCGLYVFGDLPESHLDNNRLCGECREDV